MTNLVSAVPSEANNDTKLDAGRTSDIVLTITLRKDDNAISVNGPIHDDVLCFGMIEKAKDAITNWHKHPPKPVKKHWSKLFSRK